MINAEFLNYVIVFAETDNLTKASEKLHVSQSALTRAMQKIESEAGVPLFTRAKNKISLNETGKQFVRYAVGVLDSYERMFSATRAFYNASLSTSIGLSAPGPLLKYGQELYSIFSGKTISTKIDDVNRLVEGLKSGVYDFIFINEEIITDDMVSVFAFTEKLFVSVPPTHFVAGMTEGVWFSDIDGQSFLVAENLGLWDEMIRRLMPNSKFLVQNDANLHEIVNASTIPSFTTNVAKPLRGEVDRKDIPVLDECAQVDFYVAFRPKDKAKLNELLRVVAER